MKAEIDKGIAPGGAVHVIFTEADQQKYRIRNRRTVARFLQDYISEQKLPLKIRSYQVAEGFLVAVLRK
jgi:hypothetical protein